jgi:hypothetical protein
MTQNPMTDPTQQRAIDEEAIVRQIIGLFFQLSPVRQKALRDALFEDEQAEAIAWIDGEPVYRANDDDDWQKEEILEPLNLK